MKKSLFIWISFVFIVAFATISFPQADKEISTSSKNEAIESNYFAGLKSENQGLKVSSAYFLGDMKSFSKNLL